MPQERAYTQSGANAEVIGAMIEEMGKNVSQAISTATMRRMKEKEFSAGEMQKIRDFMTLAPEKRQELLKNPAFRQQILNALDPHLFSQHDVKKEGAAPGEAEATALGAPTKMEQTAQAEAEARLTTERAKGVAETQKAAMEALKMRLATGVETPTPMNLLGAFDVKDPLAAARFALIPQDTLRDIALSENKLGPIYESSQQQDWFKYFVDQGLQSGPAMKNAFAVAKGRWDLVDPSIRGKAEQQLANETANAVSQRMSVQNTIQSSIATSAAQLAENAGIPLDQAVANVLAMRQGKPTPFETPNIEKGKALELLNRQTEIEKNMQTILNDKAGIGVIRESLNSLLSVYKEGTTLGFGIGEGDLKQKIQDLQTDLTKRLSDRYGVTYTPESSLWNSVKGAVGTVWKDMKATKAWGADQMKDIDAAIGVEQDKNVPLTDEQLAQPGGALPKAKEKLTPERENILKGIISGIQDGLSDPATPLEQKQKLRDYLQNRVKPIYDDPSRFLELFKQQEEPPPEPQV